MKTKSPVSRKRPAASVKIPAKWLWHQRTLLRLRDQLHRQTHAHLVAAEATEPTDTDAAAQSNDERDFENLLTEWRHEEGLLTEVDAALERLTRGTYGICQASGQPIPAARLRAVPWTRFRREFAPDNKPAPRRAGRGA